MYTSKIHTISVLNVIMCAKKIKNNKLRGNSGYFTLAFWVKNQLQKRYQTPIPLQPF